MPRKTMVLAFAMLALTALPAIGAGTLADSNKPAVQTKPIGHTPHPVQDIGRSDLFHGYRCGVSDCLLHQQGYQWGADHRITNPRDCHGASEEFLEGCLAFAGIDGPLGHKEFDASFPHTWGID